MELVAPAGNLEKLKFAYLYGADAVYIGVGDFSLRARAENFHGNEHEEIRRIKGARKLYGAFNIAFHDADLRALESELDYLSRYPFDGLILSDIGAVSIVRRRFPRIPLHLSTQANCLNVEAVKRYEDMGFHRIILGRELSLEEIVAIRAKVEAQLEVFVHGAMCLAYSGRCFLSRYMTGRSANRGDCAHSCRWEYRVLEERERPGEYYPVVESGEFTTLLSSKDLCMIDHLAELGKCGVDALKIEGRMKSVYYAAVTSRAYRAALDRLAGEPAPYLSEFKKELFEVSHREFSTGFYFGREEIEEPNTTAYQRSHIFLASVVEKIADDLYLLDVKNQIRLDDELEYTGYDAPGIRDAGFRLLDGDRRGTERIVHGRPGYLRTTVELKPGYLIRKAAG